MCKGERPIGAAKGKHTNAMASCQDCRFSHGMQWHPPKAQ